MATKKKAGTIATARKLESRENLRQTATRLKKEGSAASVARPPRSRGKKIAPVAPITVDEPTAPIEPALPECSDKELAFIAEFMKKPGNGSAAMIAAGITDKPEVAKVYASQYLDRPQVLAELERRRARLMSKLDLSLERVLEELRRVALANVTDVVTVRGAGIEIDENGKKHHYHGELDFKDLDQLSEEVTAAIAGVTIVPGEFGTKREIRMHSKLDALKALLEHLSPTPAERGKEGAGSGSTIIIEGGATGLEVTVKAHQLTPQS
jgi:hypothetical protein